MPRFFLALSCLLLALDAPAVEPRDLLPKDVKYDPDVLTPRAHLGFDIGERHLQHHQLVGYLKKLVASPRVRVREYGKTHGGRSLMLLVITSPENHKRLEDIRKRHLQLADPAASKSVTLDDLPAVIWMGYGVHGNEPSASNVAPLVAYHLAAGTGKEHEALLRDTVVLLDPCLNPDGFERFANWANDNRGALANADPETREHREAWPGGRTNYYYFDLNRDWLPARHPESRGRLAVFHQWKPNVVLDFHEMGTNSTYFFQPGAPKRAHPLIPPGNHRLTRALAKQHAKALDRIGSLYFTEEVFDDYYPGKGSTYPDLYGGVGVLFEQASSRGQVQDSVNGKVTFPFTIRNQFATSLSSLRGLHAHREEFLTYKRDFFVDALAQAKKGKTKAHLVAAPGDPVRLHTFIDLLEAHDIRAYRLRADVSANGKTFRAGEAFVVPTEQPSARFLEVLFERRTAFADKVFYDISTWTMPLAFNLHHAELDRVPNGDALPTEAGKGPPPAFATAFGKDDLGYLVDWRSDAAPRLLGRLLAANVKVRVASDPFTLGEGKDATAYGYGGLFVPLGIQPERREKVVELLRAAGGEGVRVQPLTDGLSLNGIKPGSAAFVPVPAVRAALLTGEGTSAYESGEVWHLFDQRLGVPLTRLEASRLGSVELDRYSVVVLVSGTYESVAAAGVERLRKYVEGGGTLLAQGTAIAWLNRNKIINVKVRANEKADKGERLPYASAANVAAEQLISGAIFQTKIDATHPLCYGVTGELPVFRNNRVILEPGDDAFTTPIVYADEPLLSGYVSAENRKLLAGSAGASVSQLGKGRVILLADNANFRGFWYGTSRLFSNAVYFGPTLRGPARAR